MEQVFIDILKKLIAEQGKDALTDAKKCKAIINDYTGNEYKKERRFIVQAVEAGASKAIAGAQDLASCKKAQVRALEEDYGLTAAVATDVVNTLALVLRGEEKEKTFCKNCGKELQEEWKSCPFCASPVAPPISQTAPAGTQGNDAFLDGKKYLKDSEWAKAEKSFAEAINLGCTDMYQAYVSRARAYLEKDMMDKADRDLDKARSLGARTPAYKRDATAKEILQTLRGY